MFYEEAQSRFVKRSYDIICMMITDCFFIVTLNLTCEIHICTVPLNHCVFFFRILELKNDMVMLEHSEYHYFDDVLSDLKLTPVNWTHCFLLS